MTRTQYKAARRLIRDNGRAGLRSIPPDIRQEAEDVLCCSHPCDVLYARVRLFGDMPTIARMRLMPLSSN